VGNRVLIFGVGLAIGVGVGAAGQNSETVTVVQASPETVVPTSEPVEAAAVETAAPLRSQPRVVARFRGAGIKNTRPFTVRDEWEIRWKATGGYLGIYVYAADDSLVGVAANQQGPGSGESFQAKGCRCYLSINALGSWSVTVVQL
jgi:hypothetical protein